jgi:hypothetical protein
MYIRNYPGKNSLTFLASPVAADSTGCRPSDAVASSATDGGANVANVDHPANSRMFLRFTTSFDVHATES